MNARWTVRKVARDEWLVLNDDGSHVWATWVADAAQATTFTGAHLRGVTREAIRHYCGRVAVIFEKREDA